MAPLEALAHLRVVELCDGLSAAYCARQFALWGADVLIAEESGGSSLRGMAPVVVGRDGTDTSLVWEHIAAGKRTTTVDPSSSASLARIGELILMADVLITDWAPDRVAEIGLGWPGLWERNPALVIISISSLGPDEGGTPATDLTIQASAGILSLSGAPGRYPLKVPANILLYAVGVAAFVGALAAIHERRASNLGQLVEIRALEVVASLVLVLRAQYFGEPFPRRSGVGTMLLPCMDGDVLCNPHYERGWDDVLTALSLAAEDVPESLRTPKGREDEAELHAFLDPVTRLRSTAELFASLGTLGTAASMLQTPSALLTNAQLMAREFFVEAASPRLGTIKLPGPAAKMSETPMASPSSAPSVAGFATPAEWPERPVKGSVSTGLPSVEPSRSPLEHLRVIDLTGAWIGPYAAMLLADLGADVIKIESPRRPDVWRGYRPGATQLFQRPQVARLGAHPWNVSHYYNSVNRNKRSLALDLSVPRGREIFLLLAADADIVLENFTPRVMDNFGLEYDTLRGVNPKLIMASFSGYGRSGPFRDFKANGATTETISGWVSLFGYPGGPPMLMGEMEADPLCGLQMAAQTLVALEHREQTGTAQCIDGAMFEVAVGYIAEEVLAAECGANVPHPRGNRDRIFAPQGAFPVAGSDEWIAISVRDDADWTALLGVAGGSARLQDEQFATAAGRRAAVDEVERRVSDWTASQDGNTLAESLILAGVPAAVAQTSDTVSTEPHLKSWFRPLHHADTGESLHAGHLWRFSRSPLRWTRPSPRLGEHSAEVLSECCGVSPEGYAELIAMGITGCILEFQDSAAPAIN